jgi:DNA mismatch repair protein MSH2
LGPQVDDEHGFIRFFKSLPTVDDDVIRIFDRGDWYTAHGENANFIARTVRPRRGPFLFVCTALG